MVFSVFPRNIPRKCVFLGISSVFGQKIPRNSFSLGMSLRITMFSCSVFISHTLLSIISNYLAAIQIKSLLTPCLPLAS
ncbi:hypothetical protein Bca4012_038872 [Brassica carinata]